MQRSKKLVLMDPKFLDQMQADKEYKQIQKPADALAKTSLSLDIGRILEDESISKDENSKPYSDVWRRYTNVRSEIPTQVKAEPNPLVPLPPTPAPLLVTPDTKSRGRRRQKSPPPSSTPPPPAPTIPRRSKRQHVKYEKDIPWVSY